MTESALTKSIIRALQDLKKTGTPVWHFKIHGGPMQRAGVPDLYVCCQGRSYWFEIKTDRGQTSKIQEHTIGQMRTAGCVVHVVRSVEEVLETICPL